MVKKGILIIIATGIISLSFIISTIPIQFISHQLSTYDTINEELNFPYSPSSPSSIETLELNVDVGNVEIVYVSPPVNYHAKIDVSIEMSGQNIPGKSYLDYFNIVWQDSSSQANFTFELLSESWFDRSIWSTKNVNIVVNIRKDIVFDIIATVNEGDIRVTVPWASSFKNLLVKVTNGDIFYDFKYCTIEGNIIGIINTGNLTLETYNVQYTLNNILNLSTQYGDIDIEITQEIEMGANITGSVALPAGDLKLIYKDDNSNIGALFKFLGTGLFFPATEGFKEELIDNDYLCRSIDYPAKHNYDLFFNCGGGYWIDLESI